MLETLFQDLRFGARALRRSPGFSAVAILSIALAIGVNTAVFSLINSLVLRPLPVRNPDELVALYALSAKNSSYSTSSYPDFVDYRKENGVFTDLAAFSDVPLSLSLGVQSERVHGEIVSGNYFSVLGIEPVTGRMFLPEEDAAPGAYPVSVITYDLWRRLFHSSNDIAGKTLTLNGHAFTIIGVAPQGFKGLDLESVPDVWVPLMMNEQIKPDFKKLFNERGARWLSVVGRLKPSVSLAQADANIKQVAGQLEQTYAKSNEGWTSKLLPAEESRIWPEYRRSVISFLEFLLVLAGLVLLMACLNVANLLIVRGSARQKEIAIRLALGVSRVRLVRQLLTESLMLSVLGGAIGLLLALGAAGLIAAFRLPNFTPAELSIDLDRRVLGFTLLISTLTGLIFGLAPALQFSFLDLVSGLKGKLDARAGRFRRLTLRNVLITFQVALSLILLIGATLFLRSLQKAQQVDLGLDPENVSLASVDLGLQGYDEAKGKTFYTELLQRVKAVPGVRSVSLARMVPFGSERMSKSIVIDGQSPATSNGGSVQIAANVVSPHYFETLGIRLLRGRDFNEHDAENSPRVAVINETMARRFWPGQDAIGKSFRLAAGNSSNVEVIGIVQDGKYRSLQETPRPFMYFPLRQDYQSQITMHVRSAGQASGVLAAVKQQVQALDSNLPVYDVKTMREHLAVLVSQSQMGATLLSLFGLLALLLAAGGIYALTSFHVAKRVREIGIRIALGAHRGNVLKLIIMETIVLALAGIALGTVAAFALSRVISSLLFGISPTDPGTFIIIPLFLLGVTLLSSYIPAWKATKIDPVIALRTE
jgi:predicted permease